MTREQNTFVRRVALSMTVVGVLALGIDVAAAQTGERKYTEISGTGQTLYRIAIAPAIDRGGAARPAKQATQVMTRDLTLSGLFKVLNQKGFLANLKKEGVAINPQDWLNIGAQGVIKARVQKLASGFSIDFFLYDTPKGIKPVLAKSYKSRGLSVRRLAHRFGDEVVKYFTKERGIFNTKIAFVSGSGRKRVSQIYVMDFDGYGVHRASKTGKQNILPAWGPGGQLVYTSFMWRNPDLYAVRGRRAYRISRQPGLNTGAAFSPDGSKLAVTMSKDGNSEIYLINRSGKVLRRLTNNPAIDASPSWSPNGAKIAFVSNRGGSPQIYVMTAGGGGARRLTFKGNYNQEPDWCPRKGSNLVAFTARAGSGGYDVFTVDAAKGDVKRLTQGQGSNKSPSWAPNGRLIVFSSSRGGLWLMDADGYNQHRIYRGGASTPAWSR